MKVLICCHDFRQENLRLMPWRYIYEIAKRLVDMGHKTTVVSMEASLDRHEKFINGVKVIRIPKISAFSNHSLKNLSAMNDCVVWSSSPMTVFLYDRLKNLNRPIILLFTGPFYTPIDIARAQLKGVPFKQLVTHYKNALLPTSLTALLINMHFVVSAVVLSKKNIRVLAGCGSNVKKVSFIPPGFDGNEFQTSNDDIRCGLSLFNNKKILTYIGSLYQIRGVDILLNAFYGASKVNHDIRLLILARTEQYKEIKFLKDKLAHLGIAEKTIIIEGFLPKNKVQKYLCVSDVVALPFILVPSDMPLGAIEAMSLGKPVITTNIDGMPEMVSGRGIVISSGNVKELEHAIIKIFESNTFYASLHKECIEYMDKYPSWNEVVKMFDFVIRQCS